MAGLASLAPQGSASDAECRSPRPQASDNPMEPGKFQVKMQLQIIRNKTMLLA
jgi:hypothetical protein